MIIIKRGYRFEYDGHKYNGFPSRSILTRDSLATAPSNSHSSVTYAIYHLHTGENEQ